MMYGYGWDSGWMILMPLLWIALIGAILWAVIRLAQRPTDQSADLPRRETAQEILDRRFASGEIDADADARACTVLANRDVRSP